jgi:hypothetical protein
MGVLIMSINQSDFEILMESNSKFGRHPNCEPEDLKALKSYQGSLESLVSSSFMDAETTLRGHDPDSGGCEADLVAYSVRNAMDRVLALNEISYNVSMKIDSLEKKPV